MTKDPKDSVSSRFKPSSSLRSRVSSISICIQHSQQEQQQEEKEQDSESVPRSSQHAPGHSSSRHSSTSTVAQPNYIPTEDPRYKEEEEEVKSLEDPARTQPMAWIALFFLVVLRAAVSIFQNTFNPIPAVVANYLGVNLTAINWLFNVQTVVYILLSFISGWIFERLGTKKSLTLAGLVTAAGCWIRWVAVLLHPPSYAVMMIGQVIASIGCPLTLNIMTKFAAVWFPENKRATAGMFVASNYGGIIAMFLMPAVATGEDNIQVLMVAVICSGATLPHFFLPTKPSLPVSPPELDYVRQHQSNGSFLKHTLQLMKNYHFWILCCIHGINVGISIAWGGLLNQAITPYGYDNSEAGDIVAVAMAAGAMGAAAAGPMLDMTKRHKMFLKLTAPLMCSTYVAFIFIIQANSFAAITYINALNNLFLSFMVPLVVELGVEVSYPIPESISTSILWQAAQLVGFVIVLILDKFRDPAGDPPNNMFRGLVFQAIMAGICAVLSILYNGPMKRTIALGIQPRII